MGILANVPNTMVLGIKETFFVASTLAGIIAPHQTHSPVQVYWPEAVSRGCFLRVVET